MRSARLANTVAAFCMVALLCSCSGRQSQEADAGNVRTAVDSVIEHGGLVRCLAGGRIKTFSKTTPVSPGEIEVLGIMLHGAQFGDDDLKRLSPLKDMKSFELNLSRTQVTDAGLAHLGVLTSTTKLSLAETVITDAGLAHIAALPKLNELSLQKTAVTRAGVETLAKSQSLRILDLNECALTDADVESLMKLTRLRNINLVQTKLTADGVAALEKALPSTVIASNVQRPLKKPAAAIGAVSAAQQRSMAGVLSKPPLKITAPNMIRPTPIEKVFESVPAFLEGATAYYYPAVGLAGNNGFVDIELDENSALYVAVTYDSESRTDAKPNEPTAIADYRAMNRNGWVNVGSVQVLKGVGPRRDLFWKPYAKGDKLRLRTSLYYFPIFITPADRDSNPLDLVPNDTMSPSQMKATAKSKAERLLRLRKFDELEAIAARYRKEKTYDRDGTSMLHMLYEGLSPNEEGDVERQAVLTLLEEWADAKPNSAAPLYALADFWNEGAWIARDGGADRSQEAFLLQRIRYRKARESLSSAATLAERDAYYFHLEGESLLYLGGPVDPIRKMEDVFKESLKFDPDFLFPLTEGARYYRPRWYGGDLEQYAARCADLTKERHGDSVYTLCAINEADDDGYSKPKDYGFDWERLKRGFADLRKRFPNSVEYDEWNCRFAELYDDGAELREAFLRLERRSGGTYDLADKLPIWRLKARRATAK